MSHGFMTNEEQARMLDVALRGARAEGEAQGRAAALSEAEEKRAAEERAVVQQAHGIVETYARLRDQNPALAAVWMAQNGRAYVAASQTLRKAGGR